MMKKFEEPKFLVVEFSTESIMTTSGIEKKYETERLGMDQLDSFLEG